MCYLSDINCLIAIPAQAGIQKIWKSDFLRKLQFQHPKMNACVDDNVLQEGRIYTRGGKLAASVVQEGLIRYHAA